MANPYASGDDDADLFEETESKESTRQNTTYENTILVGPDNQPLPDHIQQILQPYLGNYNTGYELAALPLEFKTIVFGLEFFSRVSRNGELSDLTAAIADSMTLGGDLELHFGIRSAQRFFLISHIIEEWVDWLNQCFLAQKPNDDGDLFPLLENGEELCNYLNVCVEILMFKKERVIDRYRTYSDKLGLEIDEGLITQGRFSKRDYITNAAFLNPPSEEIA